MILINLGSETFESKKSGNFAIPFDYDGEDPIIKTEENFRVFKHVNNGRVNYSLAINVNDKNEEFSLVNWEKYSYAGV